MAEYKLTYFALEGLAEPIRFLFKYGNVPFIDERIQFTDWAEVKNKYLFERLPVLTYKGKQYMQHAAICKFVASLVGLQGKDAVENMEIDGVVDTITDLRTRLVMWFYEPNEEIRASRKDELYNNYIPFYLERLSKIVEENGGYYACKRLTWADIYAVGILDVLYLYHGSDVIADYPPLKAHKEKILAIPQLKKWMEERPKTDLDSLKKIIDEIKSRQSK